MSQASSHTRAFTVGNHHLQTNSRLSLSNHRLRSYPQQMLNQYHLTSITYSYGLKAPFWWRAAGKPLQHALVWTSRRRLFDRGATTSEHAPILVTFWLYVQVIPAISLNTQRKNWTVVINIDTWTTTEMLIFRRKMSWERLSTILSQKYVYIALMHRRMTFAAHRIP